MKGDLIIEGSILWALITAGLIVVVLLLLFWPIGREVTHPGRYRRPRVTGRCLSSVPVPTVEPAGRGDGSAPVPAASSSHPDTTLTGGDQ